MALERIGTQVARINDVVSAIAASSQEQAAGLGQINASMREVDEATRRSVELVTQATSAAQSLAGESDELVSMIGRFNLGGAAGGDATHRPWEATKTPRAA